LTSPSTAGPRLDTEPHALRPPRRCCPARFRT
jgi:hypothetical protein